MKFPGNLRYCTVLKYYIPCVEWKYRLVWFVSILSIPFFLEARNLPLLANKAHFDLLSLIRGQYLLTKLNIS